VPLASGAERFVPGTEADGVADVMIEAVPPFHSSLQRALDQLRQWAEVVFVDLQGEY
jgi:hypothetical protein